MRSNRMLCVAVCLVLALGVLAPAASAVTLDGIAPSSADRGTTVVATVTGSGFAAGASVALSRDGAWIPAATSVVESPATLVCVLAIPADAPVGSYTLNLMNGGIGPCVVYQRPDAFTVSAPAPGAVSFTAEPCSGPAPLKVQFLVTPSTIMAPIAVMYAWDFGDGATASGLNPVHTYGKAGTYTVTLTVADPTGRVLGKAAGCVWVTETPPIGGDRAYYLVSTWPRGADIYTEEISGTRTLAGNTACGPVNVTVYLTGTPVRRIVANLSGYDDAAFEIVQYPAKGETIRVHLPLVPTGTAPPGPRTLLGSWRLVSYLGTADAAVPAVVRPVPFITFLSDGTFSGSFGCNLVRGCWTATDTEITFFRITSTERACIDLCAADQEERALELLALTVGYRIDEPVLTLFDRAGRNLLTLERVPTARPQDPDGDGLYDDVNGNGRRDFGDVVQYFGEMASIAANESVTLFDYNANGRIDFADVVWLFNHL